MEEDNEESNLGLDSELSKDDEDIDSSEQNTSDVEDGGVMDLTNDDGTNEVLNMETIDLETWDDDLIIVDKKKKNNCVNTECNDGKNLEPVTEVILTHYRVKHTPNIPQFVCRECSLVAAEHYAKCVDVFLGGNDVLVNHLFRSPIEDVVLIESDDEIEESKKELKQTKELIFTIVSNFKDEFDSYYEIDDFLERTFQLLTEKFERNEIVEKEIEENTKKLQKEIDHLRNNINSIATSSQQVHQLPSLDTEPVTFGHQPINYSLTKLMLGGSKKDMETQKNRNGKRKMNSMSNENSSNESENDKPNLSNVNNRTQINNRNESTTETTENQQLNTNQNPQQMEEQKKVEFCKFNYHDLSENEGLSDLDRAKLIYQGLPKGPVLRPEPKKDDIMYAMRPSKIWVKCVIYEIFPPGSNINDRVKNKTTYRVKFHQIYKEQNQFLLLPGEELAYESIPNVLLPVGERVIGLYKSEDPKKGPNDKNKNIQRYLSGIIAETMSPLNKFRYLVFFDEGFSQYVAWNDVRIVCSVSEYVWDDIKVGNNKNYIKQFLENPKLRPLVRLEKNNICQTERNGKWMEAKVIEVDCSLVKMKFLEEGRTEWIYRGSKRLALLFKTDSIRRERQTKGFNVPTRKLGVAPIQNHVPYIEYQREIINLDSDEEENKSQTLEKTRAVARKSTAMPFASLNINKNQLLSRNRNTNTSFFLKMNPKNVKPIVKYSPHYCSSNCKQYISNKNENLKSYSLLIKPILVGFRRFEAKYSQCKRNYGYIGPCGRKLRSMNEIHKYLQLTEIPLTVDMFDLSPEIDIYCECVIDEQYTELPDISNGRELIPVPAANGVDTALPGFLNYRTQREPTEGVNLNLNEDFLICCNCEDDCKDKLKCECWQLTLEGARYKNPNLDFESVGYQHKRLFNQVATGIYECNSRCKCSNSCLNRVVQFPLQLKLQLFKTKKKGWGIRCMNDIPKGTFICIYAGKLLTEQQGNRDGLEVGDEYLAELDFIEIVEGYKENYEPDIPHFLKEENESMSEKEEEENEEDTLNNEMENVNLNTDKDFVCSISVSEHNSNINSDDSNDYRSRLRKRSNIDDSSSENSNLSSIVQPKSPEKQEKPPSSSMIDEEECVVISDDEIEPTSFLPNDELRENRENYKSIREYFGKDEAIYIMDAKISGNLGRYLNHSCDPNVFVQNVFVDTHDLRFPWVAFFAHRTIKSGQELTWNYNYEIGSVAGRVEYCYCGSSICRGRLL